MSASVPILPAQSVFFLPPAMRKLFAFSVIIFAVYSGDGIMSYLAPILLEQRFGSPLAMGLVMGTSSLWGLVFDVLAGQYFASRTYGFFVKWLLLFSLSFPILLLVFPHTLAVFLAAMAVWGVYYELTKFSQFNFVKVTMNHADHTTSWALFEVLHALGFVIGPIVASLLLEYSFEFSLSAALISFILAVIFFKTFQLIYPSKHHTPQVSSQSTAADQPPKTIYIWEMLSLKLWPLLLFTFSLVLIDTAFLSVGTLLSEELKEQSFLGLLLLPAYSAPFLIMPWFAKPLSARLGKKRTAFIAGTVGGLLLALGST